ncbi:MAG: ferrochelatase, partial [Chloroflexota bacterium]|nr:ferrochelatase [Chloroflexota bacterium]
TRVATPGTHRKFVAGIVDLICERTAANNIAERPHVTTLGPWYDVCRPGCCANFRGEKSTIAGADTTVGTGHDPYPAVSSAAGSSAPTAGQGTP